ncbi:DUF3310 domain-containing protein [Faecalibaculum rodentium]|uniref:DUF3310 domain-containing protein n=3 Tax=Faecalibaculum TaxID=1729679 RepID=UPI0025A5F561|nr:DUF3310 domain-containing protein [Faecalibaculum rodentium]
MTERWKPEFDEMYWSIPADGEVIPFCWRDDEVDRMCFNFGNCFRTEEEAEAAAEKVKALLLNLHESPEEPSQGLGTPQEMPLFPGQIWRLKGHPDRTVYIGRIMNWFSPEPYVDLIYDDGAYFVDGREFLKNYEPLEDDSVTPAPPKKNSHETPDHYKLDPEPIAVIKAWGLDFCLGNVLKYVARAGRKAGESRDSDLHKAMNYLRLALEDEK